MNTIVGLHQTNRAIIKDSDKCKLTQNHVIMQSQYKEIMLCWAIDFNSVFYHINMYIIEIDIYH